MSTQSTNEPFKQPTVDELIVVCIILTIYLAMEVYSKIIN